MPRCHLLAQEFHSCFFYNIDKPYCHECWRKMQLTPPPLQFLNGFGRITKLIFGDDWGGGRPPLPPWLRYCLPNFLLSKAHYLPLTQMLLMCEKFMFENDTNVLFLGIKWQHRLSIFHEMSCLLLWSRCHAF